MTRSQAKVARLRAIDRELDQINARMRKRRLQLLGVNVQLAWYEAANFRLGEIILLATAAAWLASKVL